MAEALLELIGKYRKEFVDVGCGLVVLLTVLATLYSVEPGRRRRRRREEGQDEGRITPTLKVGNHP